MPERNPRDAPEEAGGAPAGVNVYATPEEAARGDIPDACVRVIAVVVRGDEAIVAQLTNADRYPDAYEFETAQCSREGSGWVSGISGNGNSGFIRTGSAAGTVVVWDEAPAGAAAARFALGERDLVAPVEDGFVVAVFDDAPLGADEWPVQWPALDSWL